MRAGSSACAAALIAVTLPASAADQTEMLADLQGRIQYAVFTRDKAALQASRIDLQAFAEDPEYGPLALYFLGHADFRLAQLSIDAHAGETPAYLDDCVKHGDGALQRNPSLAEAHALLAACLGLRAEFSPIVGRLDAHNAASHLQEARELAPRDPRVELLAAIGLYRRAPASDPQVAAGFERALRLFAREDGARAGRSDWGLAEAHAHLGSIYLEAGDLMRARNELEQALLIAPDYLWAAELRSRLEGLTLNPDAT